MADKVQKIREEVERLKKETSIGLSEWENGVEHGRMEIIEALSSFIDSMQEEPVSEDFEEAAKAYADEQSVQVGIQSAFIAGAQWQKQQMMANAVDGAFIRRNRYTKKNVLNGLDMTCDAIQCFKDKDKIKVLFIKED